MTDILAAKAALRAEMRAIRSRIPPEVARVAADEVADRLDAMPAIDAAKRVAIYLSFGDELSTWTLVDRWLVEGREVGVPRVLPGGRMEFAPLRARAELVRGVLGIPTVTAPAWDVFDAVIVPGLAFGAHGERLGYGKGHYDRLLAAHPDVFTVGVGFDAQIADVPVDPHDMAMKAVVTERRTFGRA
jgi:5-formyltetrahydrofolate cyclo-ligase